MSDETLLTAARRIIRFVRIDINKEGGLISQSTVEANEILARMVEVEQKKESHAKLIESSI